MTQEIASSSPARTFVGRFPVAADDDPFERLHRANRAEIDPRTLRADLDVRQAPDAIRVDGGASDDALAAIDVALELAPERADFWMMRFELLRTMKRKAEFGAALQSAWRRPLLERKLDARALRRMWTEIAGREALPDGVRLPADDVARTAPDFALRQQRFNALAVQLAAEPLAQLRQAYLTLRSNPFFCCDLARSLAPQLQRPTPLQFAVELSREAGSRTRVFLKREDYRRVPPATENAAAHAHFARALGRTQIIAGNDDEAHSMALAAAARRFGLACTIVMADPNGDGERELARRLRNLGASVRSTQGLALETGDLREAALRLWLQSPRDTHLALLTGPGPAPYPTMTADFRALLGHETELQLRPHAGSGRPRLFVAAQDSAADSIGFMLPQAARPGAELVYVDAERGQFAPPPPPGRLAAYNGALVEHERLRASGRATYVTASDDAARRAQERVFQLEGVGLSLEDARAAAFALLAARNHPADLDIVVLAA
ncbi:MAG TPA: pyridoxal-phosphate dependent enzyme [Candidatus Binatia bacterium]|nr:pyridoxal-phosphate dependent enzyme [Candidatus Binatia bacterium]